MKKWLYHPDKGANLFTLKDGELPKLRADGWCDSPADFTDQPEQQEKPEQQEEPTLTAEQQGLLSAFNDNPESLTKDDHVELGKGLNIKLTRNMSEATMIGKIQEQLNGDHQATD